jgi:hypothetical protein
VTLNNHENAYRQSFYSSALTALVVTSFCVAGCGGTGDRPKIAEVTGVVTLDGVPLPGASITFNQPGFRSSIGNTDEQGQYELIYIRDIRGAVLGEHEVKIKVFGNKGPQVPARYNDASELTAVVKGGRNEINFELESASPPDS